MNIIDLEKLKNDRIVLLLGRPEHTFKVYQELRRDFNSPYLQYNSVNLPMSELYYQDYPDDVQFWNEEINQQIDRYNQRYIIFTQSAEYIDCMLRNKDFNFSVVTVREINGELRLRYLTKEEALKYTERYNLELR